MTPHERIAFIGSNPHALITDMKVKELYLLQEHVKDCDECNEILDRVESMPLPKKKYGEDFKN